MQKQVNQTDALPLRDIHLPDAISWWPPAPGWWILLGCLIFISLVFFLIKKIHQKKKLQKAALAELKTIRSNYENDKNNTRLAQSISVLLRRASISFYPRHNIASLTGEQWLQHLDNTSDKKGFISTEGQVLLTAPYMPDDNDEIIDANSLVSLCETWIRSQPKKQVTGNMP